jgi:tetratricopeptide (TPR) repeat protein
VSINPGQSRQAQIASLLRRARAAEAHGRVPETISFLREVVQLDPHDRPTLRRLGDLFRLRMNRLREAATWYARAARANEREELPVRAIGLWRTVLQCDPLHVEAYERIGALYAEMGRVADARLHYQKAERVLRAAGFGRDAAILRAQCDALEGAASNGAEPSAPTGAAGAATPAVPPGRRPVGAGAAAPPTPGPPPAADADALDLVAERLANGRAFHHYGLHTEARRQLEELLTMLPEHVEARQLLAEVCRAVGDPEAAAHHLDVLVRVMRRRGQAAAPPADDPLGLPPIEEWAFDEGDPLAEVAEEIHDDVTRLVDQLLRKAGAH